MLPQLALMATGLLTALTSAQYVIQPSSVPLSTRQNWCFSQTTECPLICLQYNGSTGAETNTCDPDDLSYECLCSNGLTPNASEYSQTLPFYVCQEWGNQCVTNCDNSNTCADACRSQHPCGAKDPTRVNTTTSSTMDATATDSGSASTQTFGAFGAASSSGSAAGRNRVVYTDVGNKFGFMIVAAGVVGGLAFLL